MFLKNKNYNNLILLCLTLLFIFFITCNITAESGQLAYLIRIEGEIDNGLFKLVERGMEEAEFNNADFIIFEIDTPGGYVDPAIKIRDNILQSNITTVAYVRGRAWSAGALISMAAEELIMLT